MHTNHDNVHFQMTISKTKKILIEVARQLFAQKGFENTTMNDIAQASNKGRRTLYTYFRNKQDIYYAVIQSELKKLYLQLEQVIQKAMPADDKLMLFLSTRLDAIKDVVQRNGTLKADFFRNIWLVENGRKEFDQKEIKYLQQVLDAGVDAGIFEISDSCKTAQILHYALKGLEVPYIRGVWSLRINNPADREIDSNIICFF